MRIVKFSNLIGIKLHKHFGKDIQILTGMSEALCIIYPACKLLPDKIEISLSALMY